MPQIIPIRELKDTNAISRLCHEANEPIYVTKNGYGDMVIMSMDTYERQMVLADVEAKLAVAEEQKAAGKGKPAKEVERNMREKYAL